MEYETGDLAIYGWVVYECIQTHISQHAGSAPIYTPDNWIVYGSEKSENLIENGTFDDGFSFWEFYVNWAANAESYIESGRFRSYIPNAGYETWHVQLFQENLEIVQEKTYVLKFEAKAVEGPRTIRAIVQEYGGDFTIYNNNYYEVNITTSMQEYRITFTMYDPTDSFASLNFEMGITPYDVIIDNVELREINP